MSQFITARDVAKRERYQSVHERILARSVALVHANRLARPWTGQVAGSPVLARVDFGRWIADCECGGAEYVDPEEPIMWCCSCGNRANSGHARPVIFPTSEEMAIIEAVLMERPQTEPEGADRIDRALKARPVVPGLARSWIPGERVDDLQRQNRAAKQTRKEG